MGTSIDTVTEIHTLVNYKQSALIKIKVQQHKPNKNKTTQII